MTHAELLITGGTIVDGTGAPRRPGAVAVDGGRLRLLPPDDDMPRAARTIDARGKVVAPGFIDLHSHGGLVILDDPLHEPKVRQGVTTELVGVDGNSYAPFARREDLQAFIVMNGGLDGRPDVAADWNTTASYLARLDGKAVNVAVMAGNSALRIDALGWEDDPADERAVDRQRGLLRESMEDGAFGLSSGLDYPPGSYATTDELAALAREAGRLGGFYHSHVRYDLGDRFLDPFREAIEVGRRGEAPAHITHFYHRPTYPGSPDQLLALVDDAHAEGLDVTFDSYPVEWACTRLLILIPGWAQSGGPAATKERLADRDVRDRIRHELVERGVMFANAGGLLDIRIGYFARPENLHWEGRTLRDGAAADVVVFDPATVRSNATYDEPRRYPDGIDHVLVNGTLVVDGGRHTGATPGRALRRGRD